MTLFGLFKPKKPVMQALHYHFNEPGTPLAENDTIITDPGEIEAWARMLARSLDGLRRWKAGERGKWGTFYHPAAMVPDPSPEKIDQWIAQGEAEVRTDKRTVLVRTLLEV